MDAGKEDTVEEDKSTSEERKEGVFVENGATKEEGVVGRVNTWLPLL